MLDNTIISYIKALQAASKENRLVIFAGAGTSVDAGIPLWSNFVNELSKVLPNDVKDNANGDNLQLAELYREVSDDKDYYDGIESVLLKNAKAPNSIHDAILALNPSHIITTNYDTLFEDAALKNNRQYFVVATDDDLPRNHGEKLIVKMHGDLKHHNIILTENDYYDYARKFPLIRSFVISQFVSKVILFVGFSFNDPNLKFILREIKSELGNNMQHVYLLTSDTITTIENNYQFNKGINVLSITNEDAISELTRIDVDKCDEVLLSERGKALVNQLSIIREYREYADLMGMAIEFVKENLLDLRSLSNAWECLFPNDRRQGFRRSGTELWIPNNYFEEFKKLFSSKSTIKKVLEKYGKDVDLVRKALTDDDIFSINNVPIRSQAYARIISKRMIEDSVYHFYNLNQNSISERITILKGRRITYTINDLELPYILFHTGHFFEAYKCYNDLAKAMWKNHRYALFFICIFNIHSVSWPAINEIKDKPGSETETIKKQYESIDLNIELNQLQLPDGIRKMFSDLVNQKQLTSNVIEVNDTLQSIETQKRGAEKGTSWSSNSYIYNVVWNFITFLDFLTSNYIIMDNNSYGRLYYSTVTKNIVSSNLIPPHIYQSKLENLFRETLLIIVLNTNTDDLKNIYKDIVYGKKLTVTEEFKNQIRTYIDNLNKSNDYNHEIIEDKILSSIFKNIILTCNNIKDCPQFEHLDELIVRYWQRLQLSSFTSEITTLFRVIPPKGGTAGKLLSLISYSAINDIDLNNLAYVLVDSMKKDKVYWEDNNFLGSIEFQGYTDFAAIVLPVLPVERKQIVKNWISSHIKTLFQACRAENYSHGHLLTPDNFDSYAKVPFNKKRSREKDLLFLYLSIIYKTNDELRPKINDFVGDNHDFQFYIDPITKYNDPKVNSECFENISDDELKVLIKKQDALKIMKKQANHSRWGGLFKNKLQKILWEV